MTHLLQFISSFKSGITYMARVLGWLPHVAHEQNNAGWDKISDSESQRLFYSFSWRDFRRWYKEIRPTNSCSTRGFLCSRRIESMLAWGVWTTQRRFCAITSNSEKGSLHHQNERLHQEWIVEFLPTTWKQFCSRCMQRVPLRLLTEELKLIQPSSVARHQGNNRCWKIVINCELCEVKRSVWEVYEMGQKKCGLGYWRGWSEHHSYIFGMFYLNQEHIAKVRNTTED